MASNDKDDDDRREPYVGSEDRPDLTIDPEKKLGDLTVGELSRLIGPSGAIGGAGAGIFWKPAKDFKDSRKDFKDGKDIIDTGTSFFKEAKDVVEVAGAPPPTEGPMGAMKDPFREVLERLERIERRLDAADEDEGEPE